MRWIAVICVLITCLCAGLALQAENQQEALAKAEASAAPSQPGKPYTSLIVDATGLELDRSVTPKIVRFDNKAVWGESQVISDFAIEHGVVAYVRTLDEAKQNNRAGQNPLVIKARASSGGLIVSDLVLSDADADLLVAEDKIGQFLDKFNVIFIQDKSLIKTSSSGSD